MKTNFVVILMSIFTFSGCSQIVRQDDDPIRKQVEACGSGFKSTITSKLLAEYDLKKSELQGQVQAGIEASTETASAIMEFLPEADRLEGYKVYVKCLTERIQYPEGKSPPDLELLNSQLRPIYFKGRSARLIHNESETLDKYATLLKGIPVNYYLLLEGNSSRVQVKPNMALTELRVNLIADYLVELGLPRHRIKTVSRGGEAAREISFDVSTSDPYLEKVEFKVFLDE